MSTGICISSQPESVEIPGYFQNFAMDFENINFQLKKDSCDLFPYLCCPESWIDEQTLRDMSDPGEDLTEEIERIKQIVSEDYFPIADVAAKVSQAIELVKNYPEDYFEWGKEPFIADLEELSQELAKHREQAVEILFLRG